MAGADEARVFAQVKRINQNFMRVVDEASVRVFDTLLIQGALVAQEIKSIAPVDPTSATPGALMASVRLEEGKNRKGLPAVFIKAGGQSTMKGGYDYARATEFGTQKEPARPFFYPIWRARKKDVRAAVKKAVREAVVRAFK